MVFSACFRPFCMCNQKLALVSKHMIKNSSIVDEFGSSVSLLPFALITKRITEKHVWVFHHMAFYQDAHAHVCSVISYTFFKKWEHTSHRTVSFLGASEQVLTESNSTRHEIIFLFKGELANEEAYRKEILMGRDEFGKPLKAIWKPLEDFRRNKAALYPDVILDMV